MGTFDSSLRQNESRLRFLLSKNKIESRNEGVSPLCLGSSELSPLAEAAANEEGWRLENRESDGKRSGGGRHANTRTEPTTLAVRRSRG